MIYRAKSLIVFLLTILALYSCKDGGLISKDAIKKASIKAETTTSTTNPGSDDLGYGTLSGLEGCLSGEGVDTASININFEVRAGYPEVFILRDGILAYKSSDLGTTSFIDEGRKEGKLYTYECGVIDTHGKQYLGSKKLPLTTTIENAPHFAGITGLTRVSGSLRNLRVTWGAPAATGPLATQFKIYYKAGTTIGDNPAWLELTSAAATVAGTTVRSKIIEDLGDEIPYVFGVRACTSSDICDENVIIRTIAASTDQGPPRTTGISVIAHDNVNNKMVLTVPWNHTNGGIKKRHLYRLDTTNGTLQPSAAEVHTGEHTIINVGADFIANDKTTIEISGISSNQNKTYNFLVRDEDPTTGTEEENTNVKSKILIDTIGPAGFPGIADAYSEVCTTATVPDSCVKATWVGTNVTADYDEFKIYKIEGGLPILLGSCASSVGKSSCEVTNAEKINPAQDYWLVVIAEDAANNPTVITNYDSAKQKRRSTDVTPPHFGLVVPIPSNLANNTFDSLTGLPLTWGQAYDNQSDDPLEILNIITYKVYEWKTGTLPVSADAIRASGRLACTKSGATLTSCTRPKIEQGLPGDSNYLPAMVEAGIYYYTVCAEDGSTRSYCSGIHYFQVPDISAPNISPTLASAQPNCVTNNISGCVKLTWSTIVPTIITDQGITGFRVSTINTITRQLENGRDCAHDGTFSCEMLVPVIGENYEYYIQAYDASNNRTNPGPMNYSTGIFGRPMDIIAPTIASFTAERIGLSSSIKLDWVVDDNDHTNQLSYTVYRNTSDVARDANGVPISGLQGTYSSIYNLPGTHTDSSLPDYQTYYYVLCGEDFAAPVKNKTCSITKSVIIPDITKPVWSYDIANLNTTSCLPTVLNGCIRITWDNGPADANGILGYNVYTVVGGTPTWAGTCDTTNQYCEVTLKDGGNNPQANRTANFIITAFDTAETRNENLEAALLNIKLNDRPTGDANLPVFPGGDSGLAWSTSSSAPNLTILWNRATDNQVAGVITYTVYERKFIDFTSTDPAVVAVQGGAVCSSNLATQPATITCVRNKTAVFNGLDLEDGRDYYYSVCAEDSAFPTHNKICHGVGVKYPVPDGTPPNWNDTSLAAMTCTGNGCVKLGWPAQTESVDRAGYRVHLVESNVAVEPSILGLACNSEPAALFCELTRPSPHVGKIESYVVTSYDTSIANNENTRFIDASFNYLLNRKVITTRTGDSEAPYWGPVSNIDSLTTVTDTAVSLDWAAAGDNQYDTVNAIVYTVYERAGSNFSNIANSATVASEGTALTCADTYTSECTRLKSALTLTTTYYYTVCAQDISGNKYCNGIYTLKGAHHIAVISGSGGSATVQSFISPVTFQVQDIDNGPVSGCLVNLTKNVGSIDATSAVSNDSGNVSTNYTLDTFVGINTLTATSAGTCAGLAAVNFTKTGVPDVAHRLVAVSSTTVSNTVGLSIANPTVKVEDQYGNAISGLTVTFTNQSDGTLATPASSNITDANGEAYATYTLSNASGTKTIKANRTTTTGNEITFTVTANPGAADHFATTLSDAISGNNQAGSEEGLLAIAPTVQVVDQYDNPVGGVVVTFATSSGTGTFSAPLPFTATSNAVTGLASRPFTRGTGATNTMTATATLPGTPTSVSFSAPGVVTNFPYYNIGADQDSFLILAGSTITIKAWGAGGGNGGAGGGFAQGTFHFPTAQTLKVMVGQGGALALNQGGGRSAVRLSDGTELVTGGGGGGGAAGAVGGGTGSSTAFNATLNGGGARSYGGGGTAYWDCPGGGGGGGGYFAGASSSHYISDFVPTCFNDQTGGSSHYDARALSPVLTAGSLANPGNNTDAIYTKYKVANGTYLFGQGGGGGAAGNNGLIVIILEIPGAATKLAMIGNNPTLFKTNTCAGPFIIGTTDTNNNMVAVASNTTIGFTNTGTGSFYSGGCGGAAITSVTIPSGSSSASFYYQVTTPENATITGHVDGLIDASVDIVAVQNNSYIYTTAGTQTLSIPAGVSFTIKAWGAGGGGGTTGLGGGGGFATGTFAFNQPTTLTLYIGAGGIVNGIGGAAGGDDSSAKVSSTEFRITASTVAPTKNNDLILVVGGGGGAGGTWGGGAGSGTSPGQNGGGNWGQWGGGGIYNPSNYVHIRGYIPNVCTAYSDVTCMAYGLAGGGTGGGYLGGDAAGIAGGGGGAGMVHSSATAIIETPGSSQSSPSTDPDYNTGSSNPGRGGNGATAGNPGKIIVIIN